MDRMKLIQLNNYFMRDTVERHSKGKTQVIIEKEGYYDQDNAGEYILGIKEEIELELAAILPLNNNDLKYDIAGNFNEETRKLYCYENIDKGSKVINTMEDGTIREFTVIQDRNYSDFDNLRIYFVKRGDRD